MILRFEVSNNHYRLNEQAVCENGIRYVHKEKQVRTDEEQMKIDMPPLIVDVVSFSPSWVI